MLDLTEKAIGTVKIDNLTMGNDLESRQRAQRIQRACVLKKRVTSAVNELKCLHDEFDLANPAAPELYVPLQFIRTHDVALDPLFDLSEPIEQVRCRAFWINEWLVLPQEFVSQLAAAAESASLDQRQTLPSLAESGIVIL